MSPVPRHSDTDIPQSPSLLTQSSSSDPTAKLSSSNFVRTESSSSVVESPSRAELSAINMPRSRSKDHVVESNNLEHSISNGSYFPTTGMHAPSNGIESHSNGIHSSSNGIHSPSNGLESHRNGLLHSPPPVYRVNQSASDMTFSRTENGYNG